jgi:hypothetical protein
MAETINFPNPLPVRFEQVARKRRLLESGITLRPDGFHTEDFFDITNACQAIITE